MKVIAIVALALGLLPLSVFGSEVEDVKARLAIEGFPVPESRVDQLDQIEQELTPSNLEKRFEMGAEKNSHSWLCQAQTVKIFYRVSDNSPVEFFTATYVRPKNWLSRWLKPSPVPGVVIQPTLAGPSVLEQTIANGLCAYGFASMTPDETLLELSPNLPDFEGYDRDLRIEMIRARRLVDFLTEQGDVLPEKIGAIGFSRGAIAGALLIGIEPRIKFAFLGAGAVGLAHVISRSQTDRGKAEIARQLAASGLTLDQFELKLRDTLKYDGILFSHRFPREHLKLMLVHDDHLVESSNQELLKRSFGNPESYYRDNGHVGSIVDTVFKEWGYPYLSFFRAQVGQ